MEVQGPLGTWTEPLGVQEASLKRNDALLVPVHLK